MKRRKRLFLMFFVSFFAFAFAIDDGYGMFSFGTDCNETIEISVGIGDEEDFFYYVTFDANGGTFEGATVFMVEVGKNKPISENRFPMPTFEDEYRQYEFDGWYDVPDDFENGTIFTPGFIVSGNMTVYARYK